MRDRRELPKRKENSFFTTKYENVSDLEKNVDKVLHDKSAKNYVEHLDVETFSLKNKNGDVVYFLKEKTKKKNKEESQEIFSDEIISEAKNKLGEELLGKKKLDKDFERKEAETHVKIGMNLDRHEKIASEIDSRIKSKIIGKIEKKDEKIKEVRKIKEGGKPDVKLDETVKKDELLLDKIISESEAAKGKKSFFKKKKTEPSRPVKSEVTGSEEQIKKEARFLDEKIKEAFTQENSKGKDLVEAEALKLAEKHHFFKKEKIPKKEKKKERVEGFKISDEDESKLLDGKIKEVYKETVELKKPKEKKSFFKKKTPMPVEEIKKEVEKETGSEGLMTELKFKVENLPTVEEAVGDAKLLDNKIEKFPVKKESERESKEGEIKAMKLAEKHIKEITVKKHANPKNEGMFKPIEISQGNEGEEHVFFDEGDTSFEGWSPQITDKEREKLELDRTGKSEIELDELKYNEDIELPKEVLSGKSVKLSDLGFSENEWEELDFYSLYEPFAFVEILREKETLDKCYFLVEIDLTPDEQRTLEFIQDTMDQIVISAEEIEVKGEEKYLSERITQVIQEYGLNISEASRNKIQYYIEKISLGFGKIAPLLKDPNIEDISCDGAGVPLFLYHRKFGSLKSNVKFDDEDVLSGFVFRLAQKCGKHISIAEPMLDATMPDGSRIQMTLSDEITSKGSTFTIRKFREDPFSPPDLVEFNTMSAEMVAYMWLAVENGINTLFAGGTASGKTTALNALALFIPREAKIVSIEETREINLPHPNWIPGVSRSGFGEVVANKIVGEIDMYDLMKAALRQRPEYILVGEIRGREAYVLFQAMATGHATYSTVHADSAHSLIHRLEGKPIEIPRVMLQSLDIVSLHVTTRVKNKRARRCKQMIEIIDIDPTTKEILTNEVFRWDPVEDKFIYSGKSYILERIRAEKDMIREEMTEEIKKRTKIIEWMNNNNLREFRDVAQIVARYAETPEEVLKQVEKGSVDNG